MVMRRSEVHCTYTVQCFCFVSHIGTEPGTTAKMAMNVRTLAVYYTSLYWSLLLTAQYPMADIGRPPPHMLPDIYCHK